MPKRNRVNPFGELIATEARGTLMGNRGCLHDEEQRIRRAFTSRRWITCVLEFRGRHRVVMAPRRYTELFFLDEATALSAGHRPCAECQRERYLLFRRMWAAANPDLVSTPTPSADEMDRVLHGERLDDARGKRTWRAAVSELPAGSMVADEAGLALLVTEDALLPWTAAGYAPALSKRAGAVMRVLTPRSIARMLTTGYPVALHPTAGA